MLTLELFKASTFERLEYIIIVVVCFVYVWIKNVNKPWFINKIISTFRLWVLFIALWIRTTGSLSTKKNLLFRVFFLFIFRWQTEWETIRSDEHVLLCSSCYWNVTRDFFNETKSEIISSFDGNETKSFTENWYFLELSVLNLHNFIIFC